MKRQHLSLLLFLLLLGVCVPRLASAQTANDWVNQGRSDLTLHDITGANLSFAHALHLSPTNETANALYAVTRLLTLPSRPAGSNFLTRLGFPTTGRNIYNWTSRPPTNSTGFPLIPDGLNASEFISELRTNLLPEIAGAIDNLGVITDTNADTNFVLNLSSSETTATAVAVDYGDCKLIQSALYGAEYVIYTLNSQNWDVQLASVYDLLTNRNLSAESFLRDHPQFLTIATINDLQRARTAFTNAVNAYVIASDFIRARSTNDVRLFNYDPTMAQNESNFRMTLQDLENSLALGAQSLPVHASLQADVSPQFDGSLTLRNLLPKIHGNAIELGSLPDLTFDGSIYGLSQGAVEGFFGEFIPMLPVGHAPEILSANRLGLTFNTLRNHYYVLQSSTNLLDWQMVTNFTAQDVTSTLLDSLTAGKTGQFYRLRDDTGFLTLSGVVRDQITSQPIAGAQVFSQWDGSSTVTDSDGKFYLKTSLQASPNSWNEANLVVSAPAYTTFYSYYYGDGLVSGLIIYLSP